MILSTLTSERIFAPIPVVLSAFLVFVLSVFAVGSVSAGPNTSDSSSSSGSSSVLTGYLSTRYVFRSAETTSPAPSQTFRDADVYSELRLDAARPQGGMYEFHFMGTMRSDLDDNQNVAGFDPLEDIGNATPKRTVGYVYEAHLDINGLLPALTQVRLGRQVGTRDESIYFDGVALDLRAARSLSMTVYGGAAVHFYEINRKETDDTLAGAGLDFTPSAWTGISLDYLTVKDKRNYYTFVDEKNNLSTIRLWQRLGKNIKATAKARYEDSDWRDVTLRLLGTFPGAGTDIGIAYFRQFDTQDLQANELSPFADVMGHTSPYETVDVKVRQLLGARYGLDLGYYRRTVLDSADVGTFNRDFSRGSAAFSIDDLFWNDLSLTLSGDRWSSEQNDYYSGGADIGYRFARKGSVGLGTYYSLYKYGDLFYPGEMDRVRTYYANAKLPLASMLVLDLSYELEKGLDLYHVIKTGLRYDF